MAANDVTYGSQVAIANIANLHSNADGTAEAFGEIVGVGEIGVNVQLTIPINTAATSGTYDLYLVTSQDGTTWTDTIDPSVSGDILAYISDARFLKSISTVYNVTSRANAVFDVQIPMLSGAKYIGFVLDNNSGQAIPATGASGNSVSYSIASA